MGVRVGVGLGVTGRGVTVGDSVGLGVGDSVGEGDGDDGFGSVGTLAAPRRATAKIMAIVITMPAMTARAMLSA